MTQKEQKQANEILQKHFCRYQLSIGVLPNPLSTKALEYLREALVEFKNIQSNDTATESK